MVRASSRSPNWKSQHKCNLLPVRFPIRHRIEIRDCWTRWRGSNKVGGAESVGQSTFPIRISPCLNSSRAAMTSKDLSSKPTGTTSWLTMTSSTRWRIGLHRGCHTLNLPLKSRKTARKCGNFYLRKSFCLTATLKTSTRFSSRAELWSTKCQNRWKGWPKFKSQKSSSNSSWRRTKTP